MRSIDGRRPLASRHTPASRGGIFRLSKLRSELRAHAAPHRLRLKKLVGDKLKEKWRYQSKKLQKKCYLGQQRRHCGSP